MRLIALEGICAAMVRHNDWRLHGSKQRIYCENSSARRYLLVGYFERPRCTKAWTIVRRSLQKLNKLRKLDISVADKYLVDAVIGGITDAHAARTVRAARHTNPNSLYAFMTTLGNMPLKSERGKTFAFTCKNERKGGSADGSQKKHVQNRARRQMKKLTTTRKITSRKSNFNCDKSGHIARKCRKPRVECDRCNRLGYLNEKCPLRKDVNVRERLSDKINLYERTIIGIKLKG